MAQQVTGWLGGETLGSELPVGKGQELSSGCGHMETLSARAAMGIDAFGHAGHDAKHFAKALTSFIQTGVGIPSLSMTGGVSSGV